MLYICKKTFALCLVMRLYSNTYTGPETLPSHITVVDDAGSEERGEGVEYLRVLLPPRVACD